MIAAQLPPMSASACDASTTHKPMQVVLDTNVVLDWLLFADTQVQPIVAAIEARRVRVVTQALLVSELERVLEYPTLKLAADTRRAIIKRYRMFTDMAAAPSDFARDRLFMPKGMPHCRDRDDDIFIAVAFHSHADALVTKDKQLLKVRKAAGKFGVRIVDLSQATSLLEQP